MICRRLNNKNVYYYLALSLRTNDNDLKRITVKHVSVYIDHNEFMHFKETKQWESLFCYEPELQDDVEKTVLNALS